MTGKTRPQKPAIQVGRIWLKDQADLAWKLVNSRHSCRTAQA